MNTKQAIDPLAPEARTDYRALEQNRTTLGPWDLQFQTGPRAGQYFEAHVRIVHVARYAPWEAPGLSAPEQRRLKKMSKGNELLLTLEGKRGILPKKWICRPDTKKSIARAVRPQSFVVQNWLGKMIVIYFDPEIRFGREKTGGIRAKAVPGQEPQELTSEPLDNEPDEAALAAIERGMRDALGVEGEP
jgi:hypothetical protein